MSVLQKWPIGKLAPGLFMLDEESSEEEPEKFFNADREPGQKPPTGGGCFTLLITFSVFLVIIRILI